jgi:hypothetical protein
MGAGLGAGLPRIDTAGAVRSATPGGRALRSGAAREVGIFATFFSGSDLRSWKSLINQWLERRIVRDLSSWTDGLMPGLAGLAMHRDTSRGGNR